MIFNKAMKSSGAVILGLAALQASAIPAPLANLVPRTALKAGMNIGQLVAAVIDYLKDENAYVSDSNAVIQLIDLAADTSQDESVPDKCVLEAVTYGGGACLATLSCTEGASRSFSDWNVCYLNGQQFFHDDRVGDFSITFTQAGGVNSDEDG